jgi:hypothetical protein
MKRAGDILRETVKVDHETGMVNVPGKGDLPLIGPTSGSAYEDLKKREAEQRQFMMRLKRAILSTYQCQQCKRKMSGANIRVRMETIGGIQAQTLVCSDPKCDAPVTLVEDARDLRQPPAGSAACRHERLNEDGTCRKCGADCRGF